MKDTIYITKIDKIFVVSSDDNYTKQHLIGYVVFLSNGEQIEGYPDSPMFSDEGFIPFEDLKVGQTVKVKFNPILLN